MSYVLVLMMTVFVPFLIERFTESLVFTGLLTFGTVFGMLMVHVIAVELEMPYGEEFMDLPLLEMHAAFNRMLLLPYIRPECHGHPIIDQVKSARKRMQKNFSARTSLAEQLLPNPPPPAPSAKPDSEAKAAVTDMRPQ